MSADILSDKEMAAVMKLAAAALDAPDDMSVEQRADLAEALDMTAAALDARRGVEPGEPISSKPAALDMEPAAAPAPLTVDHNAIVKLAGMISWRTERAAYFRNQAEEAKHLPEHIRRHVDITAREKVAAKFDDDICELCTRMKRLCAGDTTALDLDPDCWPDAPAEESTCAEVKRAAAADA